MSKFCLNLVAILVFGFVRQALEAHVIGIPLSAESSASFDTRQIPVGEESKTYQWTRIGVIPGQMLLPEGLKARGFRLPGKDDDLLLALPGLNRKLLKGIVRTIMRQVREKVICAPNSQSLDSQVAFDDLGFASSKVGDYAANSPMVVIFQYLSSTHTFQLPWNQKHPFYDHFRPMNCDQTVLSYFRGYSGCLSRPTGFPRLPNDCP